MPFEEPLLTITAVPSTLTIDGKQHEPIRIFRSGIELFDITAVPSDLTIDGKSHEPIRIIGEQR